MKIEYHWLDKSFPLICATSTRLGGVSPKPYNTLNLAYHVGDNPKNVMKNRELFCHELGIEASSLVLANQVHGDRVELIEDKLAGCGAYGIDDAIPNTDAMITMSNKVSIGIMTADCVPVMIYDPVKSAIGVAHAGWKSAILMIASKTIKNMNEAFGTNPSDCIVAFGASIKACCYEVGKEIISQFDAIFGVGRCTKDNNLDLPKAVEFQLIDIGVKKENISSNNVCTACNLGLYYSHRAENGVTGRMMSVMRLTT
ncbi:TPA: peptidoglycan editing factor PgeF [bacterium]|nr:peptidoglycan editing factor PgeF [bacterium]